MSLVNPLDPETGRPSQCFMYDVDARKVSHRCIIEAQSIDLRMFKVLDGAVVVPDADWPQVPCQHGWEYNFTGYFTTAATDASSSTAKKF
jgi:hypothetical protein